MFFSAFFKQKQPVQFQDKFNVIHIFNKQEQVTKSEINKNFQLNSSQKRLQDYSFILQNSLVNMDKLKMMAWDGIPTKYRGQSWRLLLKYMPTNKQTKQQSLGRKRKDYFTMVDTYIQHPTLEQDIHEKKIHKQIVDDVNRTLPESELFRHPKIQKILTRILYVWHMRHPASGYVQGINDIIAPFILVFLSQYAQINIQSLKIPEGFENLNQQYLKIVQGDSYWCLSKLLDRVLDNYTSSWPGIQKAYIKVQKAIKRIDPQLLQHFKDQGIDFYQIYFKWVTCLLLRQFSVKISLRLFDTYLSDEGNYFNLCLYILVAITLKFSKKFKKMSFQQIMMFEQKMPTKLWQQEDLSTVIAQAFVYKNYFS